MDWRVNINGKEIGMSYEEYEEMLEANLSDKFKSRFNEPVYSATYDDNGGWPERDRLPEGDVYDDIDESSHYKKLREHREEKLKANIDNFYKNMKKRCIKPEGKYDGPSWGFGIDENIGDSEITIEEVRKQFYASIKTCCSNPDKYLNGIGGLSFYSCKNCGADLGDC